MLNALLFNLCLTVTLSYAFSLTYREWQPNISARMSALRLALLSMLPLVLLSFPTQLAPGVNIDLRAVPVVFGTLAYGPGVGLAVAVPAMLFRAYQGGIGVPVAFVSMLSLILVAGLVRRFLEGKVGRELGWRQLSWPMVALIFSPNLLSLNLLPGGHELFLKGYLPLLVMNVVGFMLAASILDSRLRLLHLTHGWQLKAHLDELSGLPNRRQFDHDLPTLTEADLLLLIDIDHFKAVNDGHGHLVGDQLIAALGRELPRTLRRNDTAYRYGGEEFAIILREAAHGPHEVVAERLRRQIESMTVPGVPGVRITASVGVAAGLSAHPKVTLKRADMALYAAKDAGRNRVCVWSDLDDAPAAQASPLPHTGSLAS